MPIIRQHRIIRDDLRVNRHVLYLFGDNCERKGHGGQAAAMRGEPNAVGVRTKYGPTMYAGAFFRDSRHEAQCRMIDEDLERVRGHLFLGGIAVVPADGLGTGRAQLEQHAPATFAYLELRLAALAEIGFTGGVRITRAF